MQDLFFVLNDKKSEINDASITVVAGADDFDDQHFAIDGYIDDWYLEWRLFQPVTIGLHDNIFSEGSALPIYDDNLANGNIGSDGFTVVYRPETLKNRLRLGATLPFNFTKDGDGFGGGFSNAKGKDAGFEDLVSVFGNDFGVTGGSLINANISYEKDAFGVVAESLYNVKDDESDYDFYAACNVSVPVAEKIVFTAGGKVLADLNSDTKVANKNAFSVLFGAEYTFDEHNQVGVEFDFFTCDKTKAFAVPVFWKWTM